MRVIRLALALLVAWIAAQHPHDPIAAHDLALATQFLYRSHHFHGSRPRL